MAAIYAARQPGSIAAIWFANATTIAFIVTSVPRRAPILLLAASVSNLVSNLLHGDPWTLSLAFVPPNTMEIALGSWLLYRFGRVQHFSADHRSFSRMIVIGSLLAPLAGATTGSAILQQLQFGSFAQVWLDWYLGSATSSAALLPLALSLRALPLRGWLPQRLSVRSLVVTLTVLFLFEWSLSNLSFPFVMIGTMLVLLATSVSRLHMFALAFLVVCGMAAALAIGWFTPAVPDTPLGHAQIYLSTLLVVVPAQIVGVLTARQRALGEMLSAVGSRADSMVVFADMSGANRWVNRSLTDYTGVVNDTALGRTFAENMPATMYPLLKPLLEQAFAGSVAHVQGDFDTPARGRRTMDLVVQPAFDEEAKQIGVVFCGTDVTELEQSRRELARVVEQLRESNGRLEQFVRIASHDLREPLNTIAQFCDLIERTKSSELDQTTQRYFAWVRDGAHRMRTLLEDALRFARIDADELPERAAVDLDGVVAEVLLSLRSQIEDSDARIEVATLGTAYGHRSLISLALQNLVSNAIKFRSPDCSPEVTLTSRIDGGEVRVTVADRGVGIDAAHIRELGQPFRRLHSRRKFAGTGLGLAICRRIAEQNGGRLEIESTVGEGSRFHLILEISRDGSHPGADPALLRSRTENVTASDAVAGHSNG
jgi:PAS domain S-box-containing protein